jgi:biotin carboxyl carrier protein
MGQRLTLRVNGTRAEAEVADGVGGLRVRLGERWHAVDFAPAGGHGLYSLLVDGRSYEVYARPRPGGWEVLIGNQVFVVDIGAGAAARAAPPEPEGVWVLQSPLAGIVVETRAAPGDQVQAGQVLLVVESMKMNNELAAARSGTVTHVYVRPGERVERGQALARIG